MPRKSHIYDNMTIWLTIVAWIYRNVRVERDRIILALEFIDADNDGYITVGEVITAVRKWIRG